VKTRPTALLIGVLVPEVLAFAREAHQAGIKVVVEGGARGDFDAVADSSLIGSHKPQKDFFLAACALIGVPPERFLFIDDTDRNVRGARAAGLSALRFSGPADLSYARSALSLPS